MFDILFSSVIRKNLEQGTTALKFAKDSRNEGGLFLFDT